MTTSQALLLTDFQENDARTVERKHLNEILDSDRPAEVLEVV